MRIKYMVPFVLGKAGIASQAAQIPRDIIGPETRIECVEVQHHPLAAF
jgi:hypothetical protein